MSTVVCICGTRYFSSTDHFEYNGSSWHLESLWPHCNGVVCCCCGSRGTKITDGRRMLQLSDQLRSNNALIQEAECNNGVCAAFWCLTCFCTECGCSPAPDNRKKLYIELLQGGNGAGMPPQQQTMGGGRQSARAPLLNTGGPQPDLETLALIPQLLDIMSEHQANAPAMEKACKALMSCLAQNDINAAMFVELGGLPVLIATMRKHRSLENVQRPGCHVLFQLAAKDVKTIEPGGLEVVLAAMRGHQAVEFIQMRGVGVLVSLAKDDANNTNNKAKIVELGGLEVLLATMRAHQAEKALQQLSIIALGMIVSEDDARIVKVAELGGIEMLIAAMRTHRADAEVQKNALMVLSDVSQNDANRVKIVELGGLEVVIATMRELKDVQMVSLWQHACGVLRNLTLDDANRVKIAELGGLEVLLAAMHKFGTDVAVAQFACQAFSKLTEKDAVNARVAEHGGLKELLATMNSHEGAVGIQHYSCAALDNLVADDANSVKIVELGGREVLLATIRAHQVPLYRGFCDECKTVLTLQDEWWHAPGRSDRCRDCFNNLPAEEKSRHAQVKQPKDLGEEVFGYIVGVAPKSGACQAE